MTDSEITPVQDWASALKEMMLLVLRMPSITTKWKSVSKPCWKRTQSSLGFPGSQTHFLLYCGCLFLERLGFGRMTEHKGPGGRQPWCFCKCKIDASSWSSSCSAFGIVALGLHVSDDPSLGRCQSITMSSQLSDHECVGAAWDGGWLESCLQFVGLPHLKEYRNCIQEHGDCKPAHTTSLSCRVEPQQKNAVCLRLQKPVEVEWTRGLLCLSLCLPCRRMPSAARSRNMAPLEK